MPGLQERDAALAVLSDRLTGVREGRGALVLVAGEAGIGKTALLREACRAEAALEVLWGACAPLDTPRPLGPLADIADEVGGELAVLVSEGAPPAEIVAALGDVARRRRPCVVVLEDLHWADEATLDVLRVLARRLESLPALVVASFRPAPGTPLQVTIGELPREGVERLELESLSPAAVAALASGTGVDPGELHRRTAGNPFYVTEVLAAPAAGALPATVRDAVLARAARLPDAARAVLDAVAIVPRRAEVALLEALVDGPLDGLDACLAAGMLRPESDAVRFRHEIARLAVEEALAPHRRVALHRRALAHLVASPGPDLARVAHHAEGAGDPDAVLEHAPAAAERAARLGAHREAAAQYARALAHADRLPPERRAELLECRSYECYLTDAIEDAVAAREAAMAERRALGDQRGHGDGHRWLSRLSWFLGDGDAVQAHAERAVELLEPLGPGPELAMAYSNRSQLGMLSGDVPEAVRWGDMAIALAEELGETDTLVHALNNVGTARLLAGEPGAEALLERSLRLALDADLEEHAARAYTNLSSMAASSRDHARAERWLSAGLAYSAARGLDSWQRYMTGFHAMSLLDQGRWDEAEATATGLLAAAGVAATSRVTPLCVLGRLRARRGEDPWPALDEALALAARTGELQRMGLVSTARAEARWLSGEDERVAGETATALELALDARDGRFLADLAVWRRRAGLRDELPLELTAVPHRHELAGEPEAAADAWERMACPYEAALAGAQSGDPARQRSAVEALHALGARPAGRRIAKELRDRGLRDVREGPRERTRENPAGLTARELEVLGLVAEGLRNAEIGERLFLSARTVGHHVSAILRKLGVETRTQAGAEAARLGLVDR